MITDAEPVSGSRPSRLSGAYAVLLVFLLIYFARPEDWIPGLAVVPLAKLTGMLALLALLLSLGQIRERLPREVFFLCALVGQLFLASFLSPLWRGGAIQVTMDLAKVLVAVVVITLAVNTPKRLRSLFLIHGGSVAAVAAITLWHAKLIGSRLGGALAGIYADPNDLALAIVISLPLCIALALTATSMLRRAFWFAATLLMTYSALRTGSRGGFLALITVAGMCLWLYSVRGRRRWLLALAALAGIFLWQNSGELILQRLGGTFDADAPSAAFDSSQQRKELLLRSIQVTGEHPLFGVGPGNFSEISGNWHTAHNSFTLVSSEAGLPALVFYALILYCGFANLRASRRFLKKQSDLDIMAGALLASLAGYVVGSFFLSVAYEFFPYILVAYTTALLAIAKAGISRVKESPSSRDVRPATGTWWDKQAEPLAEPLWRAKRAGRTLS
jgi:putative inorganic carbon (hco3(-)) transporter